MKLREVQGVVAAVLNNGLDDEAVDPHLNRIKNAGEGGVGGHADSDEEDEDFIAEKDDAGSPTDDSDEEGSGSDNELAKERKKKEPAPSKPAVKRKKKEEGEEDGKKKKRRKKDPNAPERSMSSFMYFSQAERKLLKKTNPGLQFSHVGRVLRERWNKMSEQEKEPYNASAKMDRTRYTSEMAEYRSGKGSAKMDRTIYTSEMAECRSGKGAAVPTGDESSDEDSE